MKVKKELHLLQEKLLVLWQIIIMVKKILKLGNLDAKRDWGSAKDYIKSMWLMLQQKNQVIM